MIHKLRSIRLTDEEYECAKEAVSVFRSEDMSSKDCVQWAKDNNNHDMIRLLKRYKISLEELRAVRPIIDLLRAKYGF